MWNTFYECFYLNSRIQFIILLFNFHFHCEFSDNYCLLLMCMDLDVHFSFSFLTLLFVLAPVALPGSTNRKVACFLFTFCSFGSSSLKCINYVVSIEYFACLAIAFALDMLFLSLFFAWIIQWVDQYMSFPYATQRITWFGYDFMFPKTITYLTLVYYFPKYAFTANITAWFRLRLTTISPD